MGFKLLNTKNKVNSSWQNLWIRFACDLDQKLEGTKGQDSRYYKFESAKQFQKKGIQKSNKMKFDKHKFAKDKIKEERRKRFANKKSGNKSDSDED